MIVQLMSLNSKKCSEFLKHSLGCFHQTFQMDSPLASFHGKQEVPMNCFQCSNSVVFKCSLRRQRKASKNYTFLSSFFLLPFPFKPGAINIHASIRVTAFSRPILSLDGFCPDEIA